MSLAPKALEIIELPPIPIPIPIDDIRKTIGKTTVMAAIAIEPIHCPTKMVSTIMFNDMTKIPIEAGTACFTSKLLMGCDANKSEFFFKVFIATTGLQSLLGCLIALPLHYPIG